MATHASSGSHEQAPVDHDEGPGNHEHVPVDRDEGPWLESTGLDVGHEAVALEGISLEAAVLGGAAVQLRPPELAGR